MTIGMINQDIFNMASFMESLGEVKGSGKFNYACIKNRRKIQQELRDIQRVAREIQMNEEYLAFEEKRVKLFNYYAKKNQDGSPIVNIENGRQVWDIPKEKEKAFEKARDELLENNKVVMEMHTNCQRKVQDFLNEPLELELHKIRPDDIPDGLTVNQTDVIYLFVDEDKGRCPYCKRVYAKNVKCHSAGASAKGNAMCGGG